MKILIIDDHEIVRRGLKGLLAEELPKVKFGEAANSSTALILLHQQEWDIVLLDINLPGRSGLEVLEEAKRLRPHTPVLVLTTYPEDDFALRSLKLGAAGYVTKSRAADELLAAVRKVLAGGRHVTASLAERLAATLGGDLPPTPHESLSNRELQVLRLLARGKTIKDIAAELALSEKTVATYRARLSEKMGLATNVDLVRYALKHQLVD